ncbi:MAG TPA: twin-arginine translocase TatA/TatE family subunit [Candidatus Sumerlaeota bacterium]|nr:twin-arginine translocase TatA/TatE family subunit [Candidatus Sumerlaeota bacterium]HOR28269.1 twin-arginine translocase TatA/TatE family subunit [Candidatus Sumerlaeota bacterium]
MFGIGQTELIVLLVIVLLIFGPKNLPRLAQSIGRSARELKNGLNGITDDLKDSAHEDRKEASAQPAVRSPEGTRVERNEGEKS